MPRFTANWHLSSFLQRANQHNLRQIGRCRPNAINLVPEVFFYFSPHERAASCTVISCTTIISSAEPKKEKNKKRKNLQIEYVDSKIQRSTDKCVFRCRQSNFRRVLSACDYWQALFRCLNYGQRDLITARSAVVGS